MLALPHVPSRLGERLLSDGSNTEDTATNWLRARNVTNQPLRSMEPESILGPWSILADVGGINRQNVASFRDSAPVRAICKSLHNTGSIDRDALGTLMHESDELKLAFHRMEGPWEARIKTLDSALRDTVTMHKRLPESIVFACGLLASRVAPGSIEHAGVLAPYINYAKGLLLWYGLCAGLTKGSKLVEFSDSLGRRLLRDLRLRDSVFASPRCDISIDELEVIGVSESSLASIQNSVPGQIAIEIFPCINTLARWPRREAEQKSDYFQPLLFENSLMELQEVTGDLRRAVNRAKRRLDRLGANKS